MNVKRIEEELLILETMNFSETYKFTLFINSLKMVAFLRVLCRYSDIIKILKQFIKDEEDSVLILDKLHKTRLWFEYGLALYQSNQDIHKGYNYIEKALDNYRSLETDKSGKWLEVRSYYVFMLLTAGTAVNKKSWLERARRIEPDNPYVCAELLSHTDLDRNSLNEAVAIAEGHLHSNLNEPDVYFVLGRLWLALGDEKRAAGYYMDGILFCLSGAEKTNIRIKWILDREIQYLDGNESGNISGALKELMNSAFGRIYDGLNLPENKTVLTVDENLVLNGSAKGYGILKFKGMDFVSRVKELLEAPGYLFLEEDDEALVKAALIIGVKVISVSKTLNRRLAWDVKISLILVTLIVKQLLIVPKPSTKKLFSISSTLKRTKGISILIAIPISKCTPTLFEGIAIKK